MASFVALGMLLWPGARDARAEEDGVDSPAYFAPIGCGGEGGIELGCHVNAADPELFVSLEGDTALEEGGVGFYEASIPADFVGCGPNFDASCQGAGINVKIGGASTTACDLDTFSAPNLLLEDSPSSIGGNVISHSDATRPAPGGNIGAFSYTFLLTNCGSPGTIVLLAAMNAFDGSGDETGEAWNQAQLQIVVPEPRGAGATFAAAAALSALARRRGV